MGPFKTGDLVSVKYAEELEMPCRVDGPADWCHTIDGKDGNTIYMYKVIGKHKKRGNMVTVTVGHGQLNTWE